MFIVFQNTPPVVPNLNSSSGTMDGESADATSNEQFVRNLVDEVNTFRKDDEEVRFFGNFYFFCYFWKSTKL